MNLRQRLIERKQAYKQAIYEKKPVEVKQEAKTEPVEESEQPKKKKGK